MRTPLLFLTALLACGCIGRHAAKAPAAVNLSPGPISTFQASCARCHGPQGSFFGKDFARLPDAKLRATVLQMMKGPGQLRPTAGEAAAMVAYNRSLRDGTPFLCIDNGAEALGGVDAIRGEVTPGSAVRVEGYVVVAAKVEGHAWVAEGHIAPPFTVVATKDEKEVRFTFPRAQWTN